MKDEAGPEGVANVRAHGSEQVHRLTELRGRGRGSSRPGGMTRRPRTVRSLHLAPSNASSHHRVTRPPRLWPITSTGEGDRGEQSSQVQAVEHRADRQGGVLEGQDVLVPG